MAIRRPGFPGRARRPRSHRLIPASPSASIVPFAAGGANDLIGRALQRPLGKLLNGTIVIENMPGASTKIGVNEVMKAAPDGHTLLFASLASTMGYYYSGAFDNDKVWQRLVILGRSGQMAWGMLEARADAPFKNWQELVAHAKKNPGKLSAGGPAPGRHDEPDRASRRRRARGIDITYVPFAGGGPSGTALLGGHIEYRVAQPPEVVTNVRAGQDARHRGRLPHAHARDCPTCRPSASSAWPVRRADLRLRPLGPAGAARRPSRTRSPGRMEQAVKDPEYQETVKRSPTSRCSSAPRA